VDAWNQLLPRLMAVRDKNPSSKQAQQQAG
jgi:hypothetical protein